MVSRIGGFAGSTPVGLALILSGTLSFTACDSGALSGREALSGDGGYTTDIADLYVVSNESIWAAQVQPASIRLTTDAGTTWLDVFATGATNGFVDVQLFAEDPLRCVAVGEEGGVWISEDGGKVWNATGVRLGESIKAVVWHDMTGIAVGMDGVIQRTSDGGTTWEPARSGVQVTLYGAAFGDARHAWVVGDKGTIVATDDGGETWRRQDSGTSSPLFGVGFADAEHGWGVGREGTIVRTADGGSSWQSVASGVKQRLRCVEAIDVEKVVVAGDGGICRLSMDAGRSWRKVEVPDAPSWAAIEVRPDGSLCLGGTDLRFIVRAWH